MRKNRRTERDFTRKRKITFPELIMILINLLKKSLQKELVHFFALMSKPIAVTKSAFSQSRIKLKPEAFVDLNDTLVKGFYKDDDFDTWKGYRIVAIDGSTMNLPYSEEIVDYFSTVKTQTNTVLPICRISQCYDILNDIQINSVISPYETSEYEQAIEHIEKLCEHDIALFDRGYGALWLFLLLKERNINYVIRISRSLFTDFWESNDNSRIERIDECSKESMAQLKTFGIEFKPYKLRLVKVKLITGETEVLVTSLYSKTKYPDSVFKNLYALRWGIEGNYNHLKNHMELENFSGKSVCAIKQDFYANVFIENIRSLIAHDAQIEIEEKKQDSKYYYKVNRNLSIGFMKDEIIRLFLSNDPDYIDKIIKLFTLEPVPIREGRHLERKFHTSLRRYRMNYRSAL